MPKKSKRKEIDPKEVSLGQLILLNRREELREQNEKNWKKSDELRKAKEERIQYLKDNDMEHLINPDGVKPDLAMLSLRRKLGLTKNSRVVKTGVWTNPRLQGQTLALLSFIPYRLALILICAWALH
mgnify:CR=1 FL=1